jgi:hypothetical protein
MWALDRTLLLGTAVPVWRLGEKSLLSNIEDVVGSRSQHFCYPSGIYKVKFLP